MRSTRRDHQVPTASEFSHFAEGAGHSDGTRPEVDCGGARVDAGHAPQSVGVVRDPVADGEPVDDRFRLGHERAGREVLWSPSGFLGHRAQYAHSTLAVCPQEPSHFDQRHIESPDEHVRRTETDPAVDRDTLPARPTSGACRYLYRVAPPSFRRLWSRTISLCRGQNQPASGVGRRSGCGRPRDDFDSTGVEIVSVLRQPVASHRFRSWLTGSTLIMIDAICALTVRADGLMAAR